MTDKKRVEERVKNKMEKLRWCSKNGDLIQAVEGYGVYDPRTLENENKGRTQKYSNRERDCGGVLVQKNMHQRPVKRRI